MLKRLKDNWIAAPYIPLGLLVVVFLAVLLLVPNDLRNRIHDLTNRDTNLAEFQRRQTGDRKIDQQRLRSIDTFSPEVALLDRELHGNVTSFLPNDVRALAPYVAARRLAASGKMSSREVAQVVEIIADFQMRVEREAANSSKDAVRKLRNKRIASAILRLGPEQVNAVMRSFDLDLQPFFTSEPANSGERGKRRITSGESHL